MVDRAPGPIRLALVRQRYNPYGGAERFVERAAQALGDEPVELTLITRRWSEQPGLAVKVCDPPYLGRLWRDAGFARCVRSTLDREHFDLVQCHERIPGCDIYRAGDGVHATWIELLGASRGPAGRLALGLNPWHRYILAQEERMFRDPRLRAVICNSRLVRDDIARRFGVAPDRLHVIYNGVDLNRYHPGLRAAHRGRVRAELGVAEREALFLYVGSGYERKGVPRLLQAFARMSGKEAKLCVVGADKNEAGCRRQAHALGLSGRVRFIGARKDVEPWYGAADAFVLPTLYDPFPNAALEALACGLPLLTTTTCGAAELVREGENGYVCDALDIGALAAHLDRLADPGRAGAMREAARAAVAELSLQAMAQRLIALYRGLLAPEPERAVSSPRL